MKGNIQMLNTLVKPHLEKATALFLLTMLTLLPFFQDILLFVWTFSPLLSYPSLLHLNSSWASHFSNLWGKQNRIVGDIFEKPWHHLFVKEQECWKQWCLSLSQQWEVSYLIGLYTPTCSPGCLPPPLSTAGHIWSCCPALSVPHTQLCGKHWLTSAQFEKQADVSRYWVSARGAFSSYQTLGNTRGRDC